MTHVSSSSNTQPQRHLFRTHISKQQQQQQHTADAAAAVAEAPATTTYTQPQRDPFRTNISKQHDQQQHTTTSTLLHDLHQQAAAAATPYSHSVTPSGFTSARSSSHTDTDSNTPQMRQLQWQQQQQQQHTATATRLLHDLHQQAAAPAATHSLSDIPSGPTSASSNSSNTQPQRDPFRTHSHSYSNPQLNPIPPMQHHLTPNTYAALQHPIHPEAPKEDETSHSQTGAGQPEGGGQEPEEEGREEGEIQPGGAI